MELKPCPFSGWISVEERLPEIPEDEDHSVWVLVFNEEHYRESQKTDASWIFSDDWYVYIGRRERGRINSIGRIPKREVDHWESCGEGFVITVTHWMPLPEIPKLEREGNNEAKDSSTIE